VVIQYQITHFQPSQETLSGFSMKMKPFTVAGAVLDSHQLPDYPSNGENDGTLNNIVLYVAFDDLKFQKSKRSDFT